LQTLAPPCTACPLLHRSVYYVLNDPPKGWAGGKGFVTADMIQ
jgi:NAD(P)H-flavin reductase